MWYQLKIAHCPAELAELFSEEMSEAGALSVTFTDKNDDPVLEPAPGTTPLWPDVVIHALFDDIDLAKAAQNIVLLKTSEFECSLQELPDEDWERAWMADFKPQCFGKLWICPSTCTPPEPDAVNLILDPGLAFGTGNHPTTRLCLNWLGNADLNQKSVIDYGCGSGILALAAAKLGASPIYAVDIDNQALEASQSNAFLNEIDMNEFYIGFPEEHNSPVDILIANILLSPLMELKERFYALINPNGHLVISGVLIEQTCQLQNVYKNHFQHLRTVEDNGWAMMEFLRI